MKEEIEKELDGLMVLRGEHPTRVRNPLYSEDRQMAKKLAEFAHNAALSEAIEKLSKTSTIPMWAIKIHIEILEGLKIKP